VAQSARHAIWRAVNIELLTKVADGGRNVNVSRHLLIANEYCFVFLISYYYCYTLALVGTSWAGAFLLSLAMFKLSGAILCFVTFVAIKSVWYIT